jgi:hypothetical protein
VGNSIQSIADLKATIHQINHAWLNGEFEKLNELFHDEIQIVGPDLTIMGQGKAACINSYVDFISRVKILDYHESNPQIFRWGDTAIAWYRYQIKWETAGKFFTDSGQDLFVFSRIGGKWLAIWRKVMPST